MQPPVHMEINTEEHFFCLFFGFHGTIGEKMPFLKCFCCLLFDAAMRLAFWPVVTRPGVKKVANDKSLEIPRNKSAHGKERQTDQHSKTTSIYFEVDKPATSPPQHRVNIVTLIGHVYVIMIIDCLFFACFYGRLQTWFFTDSDDEEYKEKTHNHLINTGCSSSHNR